MKITHQENEYEFSDVLYGTKTNELKDLLRSSGLDLEGTEELFFGTTKVPSETVLGTFAKQHNLTHSDSVILFSLKSPSTSAGSTEDSSTKKRRGTGEGQPPKTKNQKTK